jgi:hypothetical protein
VQHKILIADSNLSIGSYSISVLESRMEIQKNFADEPANLLRMNCASGK